MDIEDKKNLLVILGLPVAIAGIVVLMVPFALLNAWAVQKMYGWFVLPLGAPELNLWHIWALSMIVTHYTYHASDKKFTEKLIAAIVGSLFMVGLGYLIKGHI